MPQTRTRRSEQRVLDDFRGALEKWRDALESHCMAPPDQNFAARVAALSDAAAAQARACREADAAGFDWTPHRAADSRPPMSFSRRPEGAVPRSSGDASTPRWRHSARLRPGATSLASRTHTMSSPRRPQRSRMPWRRKTGPVRRDGLGAQARRSLYRSSAAGTDHFAERPSVTGGRGYRRPAALRYWRA